MKEEKFLGKKNKNTRKGDPVPQVDNSSFLYFELTRDFFLIIKNFPYYLPKQKS